MLTAASVIKDLKKFGTPAKAKASARFFKTGKGQYGHGDIFFGVTVPPQRKIAKRYAALPSGEIRKLLRSKVHECRLTALFILVQQYQKVDTMGRKRIARFYLEHRGGMNNWDLVDSSAPYILGDYLLKQDRAVLYKFAHSKNLWERRIAIIATHALIRKNDYKDTLKIAELLLEDTHDLIHKAVGWMLREVGKRSQQTEEKFLNTHAAEMPRTMLRYAIEKLPKGKGGEYLAMRSARIS